MRDIRTADGDDLDALRRLETRCFDLDAQSRRSLRHLLTRANATVRVVDGDDGLLAGAVLLFRRGTRSARLYSVAVVPEARGGGLARRLLADAERLAAARGCRRLRAEARLGNTASRALFAAAGYRERACLPGYYPGGEAGIRLEKEL
ncbi:acetyltransferase [Salinisphaera sp. PC39]|uniref:GNAT family N-acetyltransferase n=1 Tax=Salinisphaera sp. PC39 TaxID=1304156 RepID=UPI00333F2435